MDDAEGGFRDRSEGSFSVVERKDGQMIAMPWPSPRSLETAVAKSRIINTLSDSSRNRTDQTALP
jgi:hypothetical protein